MDLYCTVQHPSTAIACPDRAPPLLMIPAVNIATLPESIVLTNDWYAGLDWKEEVIATDRFAQNLTAAGPMFELGVKP